MKKNEDTYSIKPIGYIHTDFKTKFGIPRQGDIVKSLEGVLVLEKEFRDPEAVRDLELFSHVWLIWGFSMARSETFSPTVRPPRLGGNKRVGVFASRSPYRPNSLALSAVKLEKIIYDNKESPILLLSGVDMMDNTPIYDIKPYIPYSDCLSEAKGGYSVLPDENRLEILIEDSLLLSFPEEKRKTLLDVLSLDPRPSYQHDPTRIYGFVFAGYEIKFKVDNNKLMVLSIEKETE